MSRDASFAGVAAPEPKRAPRPILRRLALVLPVFLPVFLAVLLPAAGGAMDRSGLWADPSFRERLAKQFDESYIAETDIEPRVTEDERKEMQAILDLIAAEDMDKAAARLEKEIARNKAVSAVFDFTLANIHFQRDDRDKAVTAYRAAIEKFPKFRRAWKNLSVIHVQQGDFAKALPALTRVVELGGVDAVTYGLMGYAYSSIEAPIPAESAYRMAILMDPATLDWKMGLARSFFKQERYAEAAALCGQLLDEAPDRADLWMLQANAWIGLEQPLKAAEVYELLNHLGESTAESLQMLGDIYVNEELYPLAVRSYIAAAGKDANGSPDRALRSAKALAARGALDETRQLIDGIENHYAGRIESAAQKDLLKIKARLAVADGSAEEEAAILESIVELDPLDGEALILLGQHSARSGDVEQAVFYYERAGGIPGFEADARVRHAQLLVNNGKYAEALPLLRRAQQVNPRENVQEYLEQVERVARTR